MKRGGGQERVPSRWWGRGLEVPPLARLGHPYQREREIDVQEIVRSPNPIQHKVETSHVKIHSRLEACLASPIHILLLGAKVSCIMRQTAGTLDPF